MTWQTIARAKIINCFPAEKAFKDEKKPLVTTRE